MINFKPVGKRNPQDPTLDPKFYAQASYKGYADLDDIADFAALHSTVSRADCYGVLLAMLTAISRELQDGNIIRLGKLGNFRVSLSSEAAETPEEVTAQLVKGAKILFSPGPELRDMLKLLKLQKAA